MVVEIEPKGDTVSDLLSAYIEAYVKTCKLNGFAVHKITVNDGLVYWDSDEIEKEWDEGER